MHFVTRGAAKQEAQPSPASYSREDSTFGDLATVASVPISCNDLSSFACILHRYLGHREESDLTSRGAPRTFAKKSVSAGAKRAQRHPTEERSQSNPPTHVRFSHKTSIFSLIFKSESDTFNVPSTVQ